MNPLVILSSYISWFSVLVPLSFFFFRRESLTTPFFRVLISYLLIGLLSDSIGYFLMKSGKPTIIIYNLFHLIQFILISLLFFTIMRPWKVFVIVMCVLYTACFFLVPSFNKPLTEYQLVMFRVGDVFLLLFSLRYATTIIEYKKIPALRSSSTVWIVVAVQFYFGANIILLCMYANTFDQVHPANGMLIWFLHNVNNIIKNGLLAMAIYSFSLDHMKWGLYRRPEEEIR